MMKGKQNSYMTLIGVHEIHYYVCACVGDVCVCVYVPLKVSGNSSQLNCNLI